MSEYDQDLQQQQIEQEAAREMDEQQARCAEAKSAADDPPTMVPFAKRVGDWMLACFGPDIAADTTERCYRFIEESLELVQAMGCTKPEIEMLVDYVYARPPGEPAQEAGGVAVTLAALLNAAGIVGDAAAEVELARAWKCIDKIRTKHFSKPSPRSPLPGKGGE